MEKYKPTYIAGGATQNSIRVAQWLLHTHWATTFLGGVADDMFGHILEDSANGVGVNVHYQVRKLPGCAIIQQFGFAISLINLIEMISAFILFGFFFNCLW